MTHTVNIFFEAKHDIIEEKIKRPIALFLSVSA
jgi:hypothetical protein